MLFLYEVKKIIRRKQFIAVIICSIIMSVVLCAFEYHQNGFYDRNKTYTTGIQAARSLRQVRQENNGDMDDKLVQHCFKQYKQIMNNPNHFNEQGDLDMRVIGYRWQAYRPLVDVLIRTYSTFQESDYHALENRAVASVKANDILDNRMKQLFILKDMTHRNGTSIYNEKEKQIIMKATLPKSLTSTYEDASGWGIVFSKLNIINITICIIAAILGSSMFSREVQQGTCSLLYTTKKGRTKGILYKYGAAFCIITLVALLIHLLYASQILFSYSMSGATTLLQYQAMYWLSLYPFTNIQAYCFIVGMGYLGSLLTLMVSSLCSRYTKKEYLSLILSLLYVFVPLVVPLALPIFPSDMCKANIQLLEITFVHLFQNILFVYQFQIILCCGSCLLLLWIYRSFQNRRLRCIL